MSRPEILVEGISKRYRIGLAPERYPTFREAIVGAITAPIRRWRRLREHGNGDDTIWALKDISFEVQPGEVVGIIGRNGAGKSTLLKILSRITEPTEGRAELCGRVASLLEVGTGFHPELTGRENIYLNGAILGMKKAEIDRKFDEIVAFAEIEKFLDTPVKRYSSGMYVRLAFAVAAHLEPEVLIVDEVLAVGDAAFQKRCLGKMHDVAAGEGRTVLFVSHNMGAVQNLCQRVIWLNEGKLERDGDPGEVVSQYLMWAQSNVTECVWDDPETAPGNEEVRLHRICVHPENGSPTDEIMMHTPFVIEVEYWNHVPGTDTSITLHLVNNHGIIIFGTGSSPSDPTPLKMPVGLYRSVCHVPGNLMNNGAISVLLLAVRNRTQVIYRYENVLSFEVLDSVEGRGGYYGPRVGAVRPMLRWSTDRVDGQGRVLP
ncbi:MAG: ABC transporter ATP-binding protein [Phycisphaerae bacterium]